MITIDDLLNRQLNFDSKHKSNFEWDVKITDDNIQLLQYLMLALVGEFGEAANLIKKVSRGDISLEEIREELSQEIIDILIYVLKLINQLDIDVERVYSEKMRINSEKFLKYEK